MILRKELLSLKKLSISEFLNDKDYWKDFLEKNEYKMIVEKKSDFHWMLKKYFEKITGSYLPKYEEQIIESETHKGKQIFAKNEDNNKLLYTTNWVHFDSLQENKEEQFHVIQGADFYPHLNLNGFIFLKDFFDQNKREVKRLIENWFESIAVFYKEFKEEKSKRNNQYYIENSHIFSYCKILNIEFDLDITPRELEVKFETYNEFYKNKKEIDKYFRIVTEDIGDYVELSNFNNPDTEKIEESDIKKLIDRSKEIIKSIQ